MDAVEVVVDAIRNACPDPDVDCLEDQEACFLKHPIHEAGTVRGVISHVEGEVVGLSQVVVKALLDAGLLKDRP